MMADLLQSGSVVYCQLKNSNVMYKGRTCFYKDIEKFCEENNFEATELGENVIGENFVVCKSNEKDKTVSFVLSGYNDSHGGSSPAGG